MRYRKPKLATVHRLPVTPRLQRTVDKRTTVRLDLSKPLTRRGVEVAVYQLMDGWAYTVVFEEHDVARVQALLDPIAVLSGELFFIAPHLPAVVECLLAAGKSQVAEQPQDQDNDQNGA